MTIIVKLAPQTFSLPFTFLIRFTFAFVPHPPSRTHQWGQVTLLPSLQGFFRLLTHLGVLLPQRDCNFTGFAALLFSWGKKEMSWLVSLAFELRELTRAGHGCKSQKMFRTRFLCNDCLILHGFQAFEAMLPMASKWVVIKSSSCTRNESHWSLRLCPRTDGRIFFSPNLWPFFFVAPNQSSSLSLPITKVLQMSHKAQERSNQVIQNIPFVSSEWLAEPSEPVKHAND